MSAKTVCNLIWYFFYRFWLTATTCTCIFPSVVFTYMSLWRTNLQPKFIFIQLHSLELHVIRKCFICKNYLMTWHSKQIYLLIVFSEPQILFANRQLSRLSKDNSTNWCLSYVENANFANRTIQNTLFKCKKNVLMQFPESSGIKKHYDIFA